MEKKIGQKKLINDFLKNFEKNCFEKDYFLLEKENCGDNNF